MSRAEDTSWATPIVVEQAGQAQVIVPGTKRLRGYDLADGSLIWECGGLSSNIVASPVAAGGVVTGVPMFVIGDHVLTGLQDRETLEAAIERATAAGGGR